ncbi:uncharacterized protein LOC118797724 [Colossoma macropomum]|uniref:uncharacterized protein LOC118797724 n=1 Tax=Colossoma macropomum TaxID=42526 RepID=UPI001863F683|nr:uncharacterized protein LOC118797724 [Colossoma macropomum]
MTIIWIIIFILTPAEFFLSHLSGISAVITVAGHRGQSVQIKCSYDSGYETNIKYLCRGECSVWGTKDIPVQSGSAEDQRFSLDDDTAARVFTITITDLRTEDDGTYWYAPPAVSDSTYSPTSVQTQSTPLSSFPSTGSSADSVLFHSTPSLSISTSVSPATNVQSSATTQRNARRDKDVPDCENDTPGNQHSMAMRTLYQSLNPSTNRSESAYQSLNHNTNQSDLVYQSLNPKTNQSDSVYQSLNPNTNQSESVYQSLNPKTNQLESAYQSLNHNINQSDLVYQSLNPKTNQSDTI